MKTTLELFKEYRVQSKPKVKNTERGELLSFFLSKMNPLRKEKGYKEWDIKKVGIFLAPFTIEDLYQLRGKCERAKHFGSMFNYYVFPRKE